MLFQIQISVRLSLNFLSATLLAVFLASSVAAQTDSSLYIRVNFLYGSKPMRAFKATESKIFGGLHGGHVTIQTGDYDYGFRRNKKHPHIFAHKKPASVFTEKKLNGQSRYEADRKTVAFIVPVTRQQYDSLQKIHAAYCQATPFDYAFFGMRCTSTTREILGQIGVLKKRSRLTNIVTAFYPKMLRKRMFREAEKHHYQLISTEGRPTRKWERD